MGYLTPPLRSSCQPDGTPGEGCHTEVWLGASGCWRSLERQFKYRKRTDRVAFPLEYSPKVYQSTEQVYYYA